jgi:hypothetical protein
VSIVLLKDRAYKVLKFVALILLPALGTLYFTLAQIWGLPEAEKVLGTITSVDTFLGVLLGLSTKAYNNSEAKFDGTFELVPDEENGVSNLKLNSVDYDALTTKSEVTFRIQR